MDRSRKTTALVVLLAIIAGAVMICMAAYVRYIVIVASAAILGTARNAALYVSWHLLEFLNYCTQLGRENLVSQFQI
jgi:hypothetical protein